MKVLSLWQPWATAIALGLKRIETRHWSTHYRGPLAIHAAKSKDGREDDTYLRELDYLPGWFPPWAELPLGALVCVGRLAKVSTSESIVAAYDAADVDEAVRQRWDIERHLGNYEPGRYGWLLSGVQRLPEPIECVGRQGLFDIPDEAIPAHILAMVKGEE